MLRMRALEQSVNRKLRKLNPAYAISNLNRRLDGKYEFDFKVSVDPRHFSEISAVLREVLGALPSDRQVQAKFYMAESLAKKLKQTASAEGVSQSEVVSRCVSDYVEKRGQ